MMIQGVDSRWELTKRLVPKLKLPEEYLGNDFTTILNYLERVSKSKFAPSLKLRVWQIVAPPRLAMLNETLLNAFNDIIMSPITQEDAAEMIEEYDATGVIRNSSHTDYLEFSCACNEKLVERAVFEKLDSFKMEFIRDVISAFRKEGVLLSDGLE